MKVRPFVSLPLLSGPSCGCEMSVPSTLTEVGGWSWELELVGSTTRVSVRSRPPAAAVTSCRRAISAAVAALSAPESPPARVSIVPLV